MSKKMLFNMNEPEEIRATIVEDGQLVEFDVEARTREKNKNNIYRGYIVQIEPSLQAAFVEYGANRHGFLPFGEIHPNFYSQDATTQEENPRVAQLLRKGQSVLVQVVREEMGNKGAALTTYCTLPGRYIVLMPLSENSGISRKIENQSERRAIRDMMKDLKTRDGVGYIVRTAGGSMTIDDLTRDYDILSRLWDNIRQAARRGPRVGLIFEDGDLLQRMIRDYYDDTVTEILVDEPDAFERAHTYFAAVMPQHDNVVKHYSDDLPLFIAHNIETQLAQIYKRKIPLPSGGSIVIDATEALVAIDVNSGKTQSDNTEETAYKTNLEAATEVARQLRLRDLGGLIVIDFIGMRMARHNRGVERAMRGAIKNDKARVKVGRISSFFGLLTLSRQRIRDAKGFSYFTECPSCQGTGILPNPESSALSILRHIQGIANQDKHERILLTLPTDVALRLLNQKRQRLAEMETQYDIKIELKPRAGLAINLEQDVTLFPRRTASRRKKERQPIQIAVDSAATQANASERRGKARDIRLDEPQVEKRPTRVEKATQERPQPAQKSEKDKSSQKKQTPRALVINADTSMPAGLPWFLHKLEPIAETKPLAEVVQWAMTQPNQPPISLPTPSAKKTSSRRRRRVNGESQRRPSKEKQIKNGTSKEHSRSSKEKQAPKMAPAAAKDTAVTTQKATLQTDTAPAVSSPSISSAAPISARSTRRRTRRVAASKVDPTPAASSDVATTPTNRKRTRKTWTQEELSLIQTLRHLPVAEAHQAFSDKGYDRSSSAFRQKYYSLRP